MTSLVESAAHLLRNIASTDENFSKAWDAVVSFYENRRHLVNAALQSLFSINKISQESAVEIERLYTSTMQAYQSLKALQRPIQQWDDILIFITVQRLDSESLKMWEQHLRSSKESPDWNSFREFLMTRMLSLQAFEYSRPETSSSRNSRTIARSHFSSTEYKDQSHGTLDTACPLCSETHAVYRCPQYYQKTPEQRKKVVTSNNLCFNCLGAHPASICRSTRRCFKCGQHHHTTLHHTDLNSNQKAHFRGPWTSTSVTSELETKQVNHVYQESETTSTTLLATAQVKVINDHHKTLKFRALLDQGSEVSLVTENLVQRLRIPRNTSPVARLGVGAQKSDKVRGIVRLTIQSRLDSSIAISARAYILQKLTSMIPAIQTPCAHLEHLMNLPLADICFTEPGNVDIIIGADLYGQLLEGPIRKGLVNSPVAQLSKLGWIISGPCDITSASDQISSYHCSIDQDLNNLLERFWHQEEIASSSNKLLSPSEQQCEHHFSSTHTRDTTSRYIVHLPFEKPIEQLGNSKPASLRMMKYLQQKFENNPAYCQLYSSFLREYEHLQHMIKVPEAESEPRTVFYLPHHGVIRESSSTTQLRVFFNESCRAFGGSSLNELLHTGAKLQVDSFDVLIWFRQHKYIFSSDIEKMYRQIKVHPDDWDFQRIFWKDDQQIVKYQLTTVTYGLTCAPFLALRSIIQLIQDEGSKFPLAVDTLMKGRYVDDVFGGATTIEEAQQTADQVNQLCMAGGFLLKKWIIRTFLNLFPQRIESPLRLSPSMIILSTPWGYRGILRLTAYISTCHPPSQFQLVNELYYPKLLKSLTRLVYYPPY